MRHSMPQSSISIANAGATRLSSSIRMTTGRPAEDDGALSMRVFVGRSSSIEFDYSYIGARFP